MYDYNLLTKNLYTIYQDMKYKFIIFKCDDVFLIIFDQVFLEQRFSLGT